MIILRGKQIIRIESTKYILKTEYFKNKFWNAL